MEKRGWMRREEEGIENRRIRNGGRVRGEAEE
jgi:hypothetical protein